MSDISIVALDSAEFAYAPRPWTFADARRAEIDAHFAMRRRRAPEIWNGEVLLLGEHVLRGAALTGTFFATDYASFIAWEDWGFPDRTVANGFAMGALRAADGAFLLGVMGAHTAKAGMIYFPAGTPDPSDIDGARVDLAASVVREVGEETGLTAADVAIERGWTAVLGDCRVALMKTMQSSLAADALRARILDHLAREVKPELADIRIVRGSADFDAAMPDFVRAYLADRLKS